VSDLIAGDPPDRMPTLPEDSLTDDQRAALEDIRSGPRGNAVGPFVPLLRSPQLMTRLQKVGEHLRFSSRLDRRLFEMTILLVARCWDQQFEWTFHHPLALEAGLTPEVAQAIAQDRRPSGLAEDEGVLWDLLDALQRHHDVPDELYERAVRTLGEEGVVEVVGTAGYYTTLAMVMTTARTAAPASPRMPDRTALAGATQEEGR
jgi:4-carboxymuconolactone decarboxylase